MYKLWRKSSIWWLLEVYGHGFEEQNQLPYEIKSTVRDVCNQWCHSRWFFRTYSGCYPTAVHGYVPKMKKNAQDTQRSNEDHETVANSFTNLKTLSLRHLNTVLVSSGVNLTSWGEGASLALVCHPSSDVIMIKILYLVDVLLHWLVYTPSFPIGLVKTKLHSFLQGWNPPFLGTRSFWSKFKKLPPLSQSHPNWCM